MKKTIYVILTICLFAVMISAVFAASADLQNSLIDAKDVGEHKCSDTDGNNLRVRGKVVTETGAKADVCVSGGKYDGWLTEYLCVGTTRKVATVDCEKELGLGYSCVDGACIEVVEEELEEPADISEGEMRPGVDFDVPEEDAEGERRPGVDFDAPEDEPEEPELPDVPEVPEVPDFGEGAGSGRAVEGSPVPPVPDASEDDEDERSERSGEIEGIERDFGGVAVVEEELDDGPERAEGGLRDGIYYEGEEVEDAACCVSTSAYDADGTLRYYEGSLSDPDCGVVDQRFCDETEEESDESSSDSRPRKRGMFGRLLDWISGSDDDPGVEAGDVGGMDASGLEGENRAERANFAKIEFSKKSLRSVEVFGDGGTYFVRIGFAYSERSNNDKLPIEFYRGEHLTNQLSVPDYEKDFVSMLDIYVDDSVDAVSMATSIKAFYDDSQEISIEDLNQNVENVNGLIQYFADGQSGVRGFSSSSLHISDSSYFNNWNGDFNTGPYIYLKKMPDLNPDYEAYEVKEGSINGYTTVYFTRRQLEEFNNTAVSGVESNVDASMGYVLDFSKGDSCDIHGEPQEIGGVYYSRYDCSLDLTTPVSTEKDSVNLRYEFN